MIESDLEASNDHAATLAAAERVAQAQGSSSSTRFDGMLADTREDIAQPDLDPGRLVFIDETDASTKMARLRACS
ncbi:MAG: hypothetical protein K2X43_14670 [Hyphomonadaceae bacterium]|nr:hypothetical protein [Hyphomonadaceae bacterium]